MAKTKQRFTVDQIDEYAKHLAILSERLEAVAARYRAENVDTAVVFGGSLRWAFDFLAKFTANLEYELIQEQFRKAHTPPQIPAIESKHEEPPAEEAPKPAGKKRKMQSAKEQTDAEVADIIRRAREKGISVTEKAPEPKETKKKR